MKKENINIKKRNGPAALLLAGFDKIDIETKKRKSKEIKEAYDSKELYFGENKFLHNLAGKPVIQYVIDAIYNAKTDGERIYDKIYVYTDTKTFKKYIDVKQYPGLVLKEMTDSVGGHWKDFYFKYIDYGQRVDVFFGDTPRITSEDVEYIYEEYSKILLKEKDHRGVLINMIFSIVEYEDVIKDNWFDHRIKYFKVGKNKGKLKSFVGFDAFQARIANSGAIIKHEGVDGLMENKASNFTYNLRKALTPKIFYRILYFIWKSKQFEMVKQVKNKCIKEIELIDTFIKIMSAVYRIDLSCYGLKLYHIKKNSGRWENDIDGPRDFEELQRKFNENKKI